VLYQDIADSVDVVDALERAASRELEAAIRGAGGPESFWQFSIPKDEASDRPDNVRKIKGLYESGRLDLNQRPLAPQPAPEAAQPSSSLPNPSESFAPAPDPSVQGSQGSTTFRKTFATNLLPPIEQLLSVRQVANLLGVCTATVYKWAAQGVLPHVRIINVIRIRPQDLSALIAQHRNG
jgi:excisionase family DNA binding protein